MRADESAVSLYFDLQKGERADLEVLAEAAIHWIATIRETANAIDPNIKVRVEIVDADEGSIKFNTVFKWVEEKLENFESGSSEYPRLRKLALALSIFLLGVAADKVVDQIIESPSRLELSDEDRERLDELLKRSKGKPEIETPKRKFFKTIERDRGIVSVGVSEGPDMDLIASVPRSQFAERSGLWAIMEDEDERTTSSILDVTLVSPVLINQPRSWRFQLEAGLPEFNAVMRDKNFLSALEKSYIQEQLRTHIQMTIRLEVREEKRGGAWVVPRGGRSVVEVIAPQVD